MKYRFRLQRLLDLRDTAQSARAIELAVARRAEMTATERLAEIVAQRAVEQDRIRSLQTRGGTPAGEIHGALGALQMLEGQLQQAERAVGDARATTEERLAAFQVASREHRVIERLKEKDQEAFRTAERRLDNRRMDEIALARFTRHNPTPR